jgi:hypothetical protein
VIERVKTWITTDRILTSKDREALRRARVLGKKHGHAGTPGEGPDQQTCGSCGQIRSRQIGPWETFKCNRMRAKWTDSSDSDVRRKDPACEKWEISRW